MPITKETISHLPDLTEIITETDFVRNSCGYIELRKRLPVVEAAEIMGPPIKLCLDGDNDKYHQSANLCYVAGVYQGQFLAICDTRMVRNDIQGDNYTLNPHLIELSGLETYKPLGVVGDRK
jgi:hypothetical protein